MQNKQTFIAFTFIMLLFILLTIGCQKHTTDVTIDPGENDFKVPTPTENPEDKTPLTNNEDTPIQKKDNDAHISSSTDTEEDKVIVEADESETEDNISESDQEPLNSENKEPNYDTAIPYNPSKPTLMGLTINLPKDEIKANFGTPNEEYVMEDPKDPITVYEYTGFLIGYNKKNLIAFIDVNSDQVDPGLNGLKLGYSVDEAIKALGNPDTRTDYVMNYKSDETNLKLDIDPNTNTINSIKLFGTN